MSIPLMVVDVEIELTSEVLGTRPRHPELLKTWLDSIEGKGADELSSIPHHAGDDIVDKELRYWTGFSADYDTDELYMWDYQLKGLLKELANNYGRHLDIKNMRSKVEKFVFVRPRKIYLGLTEADTVVERPLRCETARGPRVVLIKSDALAEGTRIGFQLHILDHEEVTPEAVERLLQYGEYLGLGRWRTGGYGQFKLVKFARQRLGTAERYSAKARSDTAVGVS